MPDTNTDATLDAVQQTSSTGDPAATTQGNKGKTIEDYAKQLDTLDGDGDATLSNENTEPKHTKKGDDKADPKATLSDENTEGEDIPDDYDITDEDGITQEDLEGDPALAKKYADFQKGIRAKFAKLDSDYKSKIKELEAREKDVTEHEAVLLEALNDGLELPKEKQAALAKLVEKVPYVKELIDRANSLQTEYINLYAQRVRDEAYRHLAELGYSAKEAEALFAADNGAKATKIASLLTNGLSIEEALRAIGVGSKRKKLTTPVTTTTNTKKDLTYEEKLAKYSKQLD